MIVLRIHCDSEFRKVLDEVKVELGLEVTYAATNAHVPQAERNNRTIKERVRAAFHRLPYKAIPKVLIQQLVELSAAKLNYFPSRKSAKRIEPSCGAWICVLCLWFVVLLRCGRLPFASHLGWLGLFQGTQHQQWSNTVVSEFAQA